MRKLLRIYDRGRGGEERWEVLKSTHTEVPSETASLLVRVARRSAPNAMWRWQMFSLVYCLEVENAYCTPLMYCLM